MKKINNENLFVVVNDGEMTARFFEDEDKYNKWLEYTTQNGHDMISFYMIKKMMSQYHAITEEEFNNL